MQVNEEKRGRRDAPGYRRWKSISLGAGGEAAGLHNSLRPRRCPDKGRRFCRPSIRHTSNSMLIPNTTAWTVIPLQHLVQSVLPGPRQDSEAASPQYYGAMLLSMDTRSAVPAGPGFRPSPPASAAMANTASMTAHSGAIAYPCVIISRPWPRKRVGRQYSQTHGKPSAACDWL